MQMASFCMTHIESRCNDQTNRCAILFKHNNLGIDVLASLLAPAVAEDAKAEEENDNDDNDDDDERGVFALHFTVSFVVALDGLSACGRVFHRSGGLAHLLSNALGIRLAGRILALKVVFRVKAFRNVRWKLAGLLGAGASGRSGSGGCGRGNTI